MVVLGSGGHTTEMLKLIKRIDHNIYTPITFIIAETDKTSIEKTIIDWKPSTNDIFVKIPRSREVGYTDQSHCEFYLVICSNHRLVNPGHRPSLVLCVR
jgi:beta-1,4-N-acetylglucosaminyltransferase